MKKLTTLSFALVVAMNAGAQITINQSSFASWTPGIDTFRDVSQYNAAPMANGNWDLTAATYNTYYTTTKLPMTNPSFPQATYVLPSFYSFSAFTYMSDIAYGITSQGIQRFGETMGRQAYPLGSMTQNNMDSLIFIAQTITYSVPRTNLAFPATYNTHWSNNYNYNTNFELSVAAYGLSYTPGYRRSNVTTTDTVIGWGTMKVKLLNGQSSAPINVLAVKTKVQVVDSFFLGGNPAPTPMLTAFGLTQGQVVNSYRIAYYRPGETESLLLEVYTDNTYTTKSASSVHQNRLSSITGIADINGGYEIKLYPNPATSGIVSLELPKELNGAALSYQMIDVSGKVVSANKLQTNGGAVTIDVNGLAAGSYSVTILKDGKPATMRKLIVQ